MPSSRKGKAYRQPKPPRQPQRAAGFMWYGHAHITWGLIPAFSVSVMTPALLSGTTLQYQLCTMFSSFANPQPEPSLGSKRFQEPNPGKVRGHDPTWSFCLPSLACSKNGNSSKCHQMKGERREKQTGHWEKETQDHLGQNLLIIFWKTLSYEGYILTLTLQIRKMR